MIGERCIGERYVVEYTTPCNASDVGDVSLDLAWPSFLHFLLLTNAEILLQGFYRQTYV